MNKQEVYNNLILLTITGSRLYGTNTVTSDDDRIGIFVPNANYIYGLGSIEQLEIREDTGTKADYTYYNIIKFIRLAINNNPNILSVLYTNRDSIIYSSFLGDRLLKAKDLFLSKKCADSYLGYVHAQRHKIILKDKVNGKRMDLINKYGYDCYHEDTEFLTKTGWKKYNEIKDDYLATINQESHQIEFQKPFERIRKKYSGKMYHFESNFTKMIVTPNHRMYVSPLHRSKNNNFSTKYLKNKSSWQFLSANSLDKGWRSYHHIMTAPTPSLNNLPNIDNDLLNLIGFFISDGTFGKFNKKTKRPNEIRICQTTNGKKDFIKIMRNLSPKYFFKEYTYERNGFFETTWVSSNKNIVNFIYDLCGHSSGKHLPVWITEISSKQALVLINALVLGDGTFLKNGFVYYTNSKIIADGVQILSIIAGRDCNIRREYIHNDCKMYQVYIKNKASIPKSMNFNSSSKKYENKKRKSLNGGELIQYDGHIVCFSVPNELLITRFDGKIAIQGNTKFAMHLIRLLYELKDILKHNEIIYPSPNCIELTDIRNGKYTQEEVLAKSYQIQAECEDLLISSKLRLKPDTKAIEILQMDIIESFLNKQRVDFYEKNSQLDNSKYNPFY